MILEDVARIALASLAAHKLRSALNLLGIIIAVMTIVAVISVVSGLNKYAADVISGLGPNTLIFTKFGIIRSREAFLDALKRKDITQDDLEAVRRLVPQARRIAGRVTSSHAVYAGGRRLADTFVLGAESEFPWMIGLELQDGRFFTETEDAAARAVAVIGWDVKDELFPHEDPIGREIKVEGRPFRIIGTMAKQGSAFGQSQDRFVLVPLAAYQHAFGITRSVDIYVEVPDAASRQAVEDAVRLVLRSRRGTPFSAADPFGIVDAGRPQHALEEHHLLGVRARDLDFVDLARRRRRRDRQHDVRLDRRAHPRDRPPQGARRPPPRPPPPVPVRSRGAELRRRRDRRRARLARRARGRALEPVPGPRDAGPRHRGPCRGDAVGAARGLAPGDARRPPRPDRRPEGRVMPRRRLPPATGRGSGHQPRSELRVESEESRVNGTKLRSPLCASLNSSLLTLHSSPGGTGGGAHDAGGTHSSPRAARTSSRRCERSGSRSCARSSPVSASSSASAPSS